MAMRNIFKAGISRNVTDNVHSGIPVMNKKCVGSQLRASVISTLSFARNNTPKKQSTVTRQGYKID